MVKTCINIQLKIALSVDKVRIPIKILAEIWALIWQIKLTFASTQTERPAISLTFILPPFKALHGNARKEVV